MNARDSLPASAGYQLSYVRDAGGGFFDGLRIGAQRLGFDYCGYTIGVPAAGDGFQFVMINSFPRLWQERYRRCGFQAVDPTLLHGMRDPRPLVWSRESLDASEGWRQAARASGFNHGWTKATHDAAGRFGILTLARRNDPIGAQELQDNLSTMLWLAQIAHTVLFRILLARHRHRTRATLTTREILVLRLAADGQSPIEIANAVGISERTVGFHTTNAMAKLGAANKTHAVATAMRMGLLD